MPQEMAKQEMIEMVRRSVDVIKATEGILIGSGLCPEDAAFVLVLAGCWYAIYADSQENGKSNARDQFHDDFGALRMESVASEAAMSLFQDEVSKIIQRN